MRLLDVPAEKKPRAKVTKKKVSDGADAKPVVAKKKVSNGADAKPAVAKKEVKQEPQKEAKPARASKRAGGTLVIVESPAKASTIKKYLGAGFEVKASVGHVKDLPKATIGIDIEHDFQPKYVVIDSKKKIIAEIKTAAKRASRVLLAPDPDREGEAIAWHIADEIRDSNDNIHRVMFNEITKKAVLEAIEHPLELDLKKYESQQARRVLDRLVGYQISPILWTKVRRGLSAGRVQSVAVRLLVEREEEIKAFQTEEYWSVEVQVEGQRPPPFAARVVKVDGDKPVLTNEGQAMQTLEFVRQALRKSRRSSARSGARIRPRRSSPRASSKRLRASCASRPSGPWGWPSACTKVSSSARKAPPVSSPTCVPIPRASPTMPCATCAP